jgi:hypothetical protein
MKDELIREIFMETFTFRLLVRENFMETFTFRLF